MNKLAIAALAATGFAGPAVAADMPVKAVPKAPPPAYSWTGCYIGAGGGTGMWNSDDTTITTATGAAAAAQTDFGGRGWFGTVQGGCDYQFASSWVFGAFADYDFGKINGDSNITGPFATIYGEEEQKWSWAVGARLGWLPFERLMAYVLAGYTQARYDQVNYAPFGGAISNYIDAHTYDGWFIGTGYEYNIGWLPGLTWKTEYRFADYGEDRLTLFAVGGAPTAFSVDKEKTVHTIRSELVWRFNWWR